jgi:hypothetical protein
MFVGTEGDVLIQFDQALREALLGWGFDEAWRTR